MTKQSLIRMWKKSNENVVDHHLFYFDAFIFLHFYISALEFSNGISKSYMKYAFFNCFHFRYFHTCLFTRLT